MNPILTRLDVDKTWDDLCDNPKWKGKLDKYIPLKDTVDHAVTLVGCTKTHFIVRNSWGLKWSDKGFGYAADAYAKRLFNEAYRIAI